MDVKFIATTNEKLDEIPIVPGQVIAILNQTGYYYDATTLDRRAIHQIRTVKQLPEEGSEDLIYVVPDDRLLPDREDVTKAYIWYEGGYLMLSGIDNIVNQTERGLAPAITDTEGYLRGDGSWSKQEATQSSFGFMSASDKTKLDGIQPGSNKYVLPKATKTVLGGVTVGDNITLVDGSISIVGTDVDNALGYNPPDRSTASSSNDGLMSSSDKTYFDTLSTQFATIASSLQSLQNQIDALVSGDISEITKKISDIQSDVSTLKTDVSALKTAVSGLTADVSTLKTNVSTLTSDLATANTSIAANSSDIAKLKTDTKACADKLALFDIVM